MLNKPGDPIGRTPDTESPGRPDAAPLRQIAVIGIVGLYLFGMVWLYVKLPWFAFGAFGIAVVMVIAGLIDQQRRGGKQSRSSGERQRPLR